MVQAPRRDGPRFALAVILGLGVAACGAGLDPDARPADAGPAAPDATADGSPQDATVDVPQDASPPSLQVGEGEHGFVPLEDGDPLTLYMGFQGGWHVFPGVRAAGVAPEGAVLSYVLREPETGEVQTFPRQITLADDRVLWHDEGWDRFGDALIITGLDVDVLGRTLELQARLTDAGGTLLLEDARLVVIMAPDS